MSPYRDLAVIALEARASAPNEPVATLAQVRECWDAGDKLGALRIASKFFDPRQRPSRSSAGGTHTPTRTRTSIAPIGKDPTALVTEPSDALARSSYPRMSQPAPQAASAGQPPAAPRQRSRRRPNVRHLDGAQCARCQLSLQHQEVAHAALSAPHDGAAA